MGKGVAIKDEKRTRHYRSPVHTDNVHLPRPTRRSRWSTVALRSLRLGAGGSCAPHRRYAVIAAPYTVFTKEATDPRTATGERSRSPPSALRSGHERSSIGFAEGAKTSSSTVPESEACSRSIIADVVRGPGLPRTTFRLAR